MTVQETYSASWPRGVPGQLARLDSARVVMSGIVEPAAGIAPGLIVFHGATEQFVRPPAATDAAVADVDAILATGGASTAGVQNLTGASLDGVIGDDEMFPPRNATLTFSSHADWDATTAVLTGLDPDGKTITEDFAIPNGGNATVTGSKLFKKVTNIMIPAQSGTGGTFTAGTGSLLGSVQHRVAGISVFTPAREPGVYPQKSMIPVLRQGAAFMKSETAANRDDPVYVRFVATGDEVLGEVRSTPDANDCVLIEGIRYAEKITAGGIVMLDANLPS